MIRILLVDDHDLIRTGLRQILELDRTLRVVGEASRALDGISLVEKEQPDIVFMDIRMPGMNGIEATRILKGRHPKTKVILLTNFDEKEYVLEGLKAGAAGFILKNIGKEEFHRIVHDVYEDKSVLDPGVTSVLINEALGVPAKAQDGPETQVPDKLTQREFEILELISLGRSNKEIGDTLHISEHTIKFHIKTIFRKLGARSRSEAVYKAVKNNLISQKRR